MFKEVKKYPAFVFEYLKANLAMEMEYRGAFIARMFGMIVNDAMWLTFWILYFTRFPVVQGWGKNDIITLWGICALGYGLGHGVFGNALNLATTIQSGNLDFYLVYPKNVLLHAICSRINSTAMGDVVFGPLVYVILVGPSLASTGVFLISGVLVAMIFVGFSVLAGSLAFFIGNSEGIAGQMANSLIHFSTYPSAIFHGGIKVVLFTVVPAGFINSIPVKVIRDFDPPFFAALIVAAFGFVWAGNRLFKAGLKRYESGNLVQVRT